MTFASFCFAPPPFFLVRFGLFPALNRSHPHILDFPEGHFRATCAGKHLEHQLSNSSSSLFSTSCERSAHVLVSPLVSVSPAAGASQQPRLVSEHLNPSIVAFEIHRLASVGLPEDINRRSANSCLAYLFQFFHFP